MVALIHNMADLARGRLGGGFPVTRDVSEPLEPVLRGVIAELHVSYADRVVETTLALSCDRVRVAQLFADLLGNALAYGSKDQPVRVSAMSGGKISSCR
jgi:signal transduction histidine kinase